MTDTHATTANTPAELRDRNRKAAWVWGSLVVALLGGQVAIGVAAIVLATGDPSFAVVPDYHEKAIHWDDTAGAQAASDKLGWHAAIMPAASADLLGHRSLVITLSGPQGQPITGATVQVRMFHHARAGEPVQATLRGDGNGHYSDVVPMRREGLWQIEITATRGADQRFIASETVDTEEARS